MVNWICRDFEGLAQQAPQTIDSYLYTIANRLDKMFGEGYAKEHPELLASLVSSATVDFCVAAALKVLQELALDENEECRFKQQRKKDEFGDLLDEDEDEWGN